MPQLIKRVLFIVLSCFAFSFAFATGVGANNTPNFTQQINAGTLTVDIVDGSYVPVANPTVPMSDVNFSASCTTSTGTLGTVSQRIYVENPGQADDGWTVSMAATGGPTSFWDNLGAGPNYDFNDEDGCIDGADTDSLGGQMTVNPATGAIANGQCVGCSTTGVSLGTSDAYEEGVIDSITLLSATSGADDVADYVITGISVSQEIPAAQEVGSYELDMTLTIVAL